MRNQEKCAKIWAESEGKCKAKVFRCDGIKKGCFYAEEEQRGTFGFFLYGELKVMKKHYKILLSLLGVEFLILTILNKCNFIG